MHVALSLLKRGDEVTGVDNLNDYYDVRLKKARLERLLRKSKFVFQLLDIANQESLNALFKEEGFDRVIHLAAQAGVRYSLSNPNAYISANIQGFMNILECCRFSNVEHLVYASSSSVYGGNSVMPFSEHHTVDHPVSIYAASKKSNELMAHSYSHLFNLPTTGLRFFTVYGPWGRPDMALFLFTKAMLAGKHIDVFNNGQMVRDFTYIDDIVRGVVSVLDKPAVGFEVQKPIKNDTPVSSKPYRVFNIGNGNPTPLMAYIEAIESELKIRAKMNMLPMQPGDVPKTFADTSELVKWTGFKPNTPINKGVKKFVQWYLSFYGH
jgi:UDP-glucuronate 4-epimerase